MILQRYIGLNVAKGWLLVFLVLGAVFGLISFTQELDHTEQNYDALAVARFTLLTLPNQIVSLAPRFIGDFEKGGDECESESSHDDLCCVTSRRVISP